MHRPVLGAAEYDTLCLCDRGSGEDVVSFEPAPPATGVVDSAVELFALFLPVQDPNVQVKLLKEMLGSLQSVKTERNPGRRMAILVNAVVALLGALRHTMQSGGRHANQFALSSVNSLFRDVLKVRQ